MATYTLFCAPSDQADVPMGTDYESIDDALGALPQMMSEWNAQRGAGDDPTAEQCRWYVWNNDRREVVEDLAPLGQAQVVTDAIAQSITRDATITLDDAPGLRDELLGRSDDNAQTDGVAEYWGTDDDGNDWRVHVRIA